MSNAVSDMESIAMRVVAKSVAKNPDVAEKAAGNRHQVSGLKKELTQNKKAQEKVLAVGEKVVKELVRCKMAAEPGRSENDVLLEVLTTACKDAFGFRWSNEDVDEIQSWCAKESGGTVVGPLRTEVFRNAMASIPAAAMMPGAAGAVAGPVMGEGLGGVGEVTPGLSRGSNMVVVLMGEENSGVSSSDDTGAGGNERKRRRVSAGTEESLESDGVDDDSSEGDESSVEM
jgi:hypothetical protein